ncbi:RNA-directed DNA polymerase, eukaryota, nucleotide-binding alpha-beta plait domain protein [Tanacetum coccineum]|uniref:RNA-directed DNA polymerase, eukaryota, nucleotide-binding alpha-beta plait domain protein n=1 Tax=Tanacetum coccineum TaxID=301880 RepID=A0ABQ4Y215_9ASTR
MAIGTGHRSNNYSESKRNDHLDNNRRQEQRNKVQDLWDICNKWGVVIDVYIAAKRSKSGHRFGFVRFINVNDINQLVSNLRTAWMGGFHLFADVAKYGRTYNRPVETFWGRQTQYERCVCDRPGGSWQRHQWAPDVYKKFGWSVGKQRVYWIWKSDRTNAHMEVGFRSPKNVLTMIRVALPVGFCERRMFPWGGKSDHCASIYTPGNDLNIAAESGSSWIDYIGPLTSDEIDSDKRWSYRDPNGNIHGLFSPRTTFMERYFPNDLQIWSYYGNVKEAILLHNALSRQTKDAG